MRLRFKGTAALPEYHTAIGTRKLDFHDGEEKEVPDDRARKLLADFPGNFLAASAVGLVREMGEAPADRMMKKPKKKK
jgi:hypothetical protein